VPPDVVLVRGNARQLMLPAEAAQAAGVAGTGAAMGRPTCAVHHETLWRLDFRESEVTIDYCARSLRGKHVPGECKYTRLE